MIKTPLRYPGGKSRAVKKILPFLPNANIYYSPFVGGGSIELALAERGGTVCCSDLNKGLIKFWQSLKNNKDELIDEITGYYYTMHEWSERNIPLKPYLDMLRKELRDEHELTDIELGALFFVINRCSFSGATLSGGFNVNPLNKPNGRFTKNCIVKLQSYDLSNMTFLHCDYEVGLSKSYNDAVYLDPPYLLENNNLYGANGDLHKNFNHRKLREVLNNRKGFWLMSYNDSPVIHELYEGYYIKNIDWAYGMSKNKKSSEILISNYPIREVL